LVISEFQGQLLERGTAEYDVDRSIWRGSLNPKPAIFLD
jgi:hypothetical protein